MTPLGYIAEYIFDIMNAHGDEEMKRRIMRELNYQYFELCKNTSWMGLRAGPVDLDFTAADDTGLLLPADLMGIDLVWDDDNEQEFFETEKAAAQPDEDGYRFYRDISDDRLDLFAGSDLVVAKGGTSFTSAALSAWLAADATRTVEDEYVQFGSEPGLYKITNNTSPFTFGPAFYGKAIGNGDLRVRPWECAQRMTIIDESEDRLFDRTVSVYYWRQPIPLYRMSDIPQLPSLEILKFRTLRALPESRTIFGVSETMLDKALKDALRMNPRFVRPPTARDIHNRRMDVTTNLFRRR